jgi:hypothetical protein
MIERIVVTGDVADDNLDAALDQRPDVGPGSHQCPSLSDGLLQTLEWLRQHGKLPLLSPSA